MASSYLQSLPSHRSERNRALWYWLKALPETAMALRAGKEKKTVIKDALLPFDDHFTDVLRRTPLAQRVLRPARRISTLRVGLGSDMVVP
jgi:hypothetical protein